MSEATFGAGAGPASRPSAIAAQAARQRDVRLDFFRGVAMFIILVAHVPSDWLALWIPARFGFSDATEMFVFCSGMASAIAFGRVFRDRGLLMGAARVAFRVWQVYWAHIGLFIAVASAMALLNATGLFEKDYVDQLNLQLFFNNAAVHLPALLTLTYVPNYFDILPMYLVVLAMMPIVVALARISRWAAAAFCVALWLAGTFGLTLPAEPLSGRPWFFNPFGWQLLFFTGFAFMSGWLPAPPQDRRLVIVAVLIVLVSVPLNYYRIINVVPRIAAWRADAVLLLDKSDFGLLRYVHFLALAYLAVILAGPKGSTLAMSGTGALGRAWQRVLGIILTVGQQSLAVFVFSMFIAQLLGAVLDVVGRSALSMVWVNALGFALIIGAAHVAAWFKRQPWKTRAAASD